MSSLLVEAADTKCERVTDCSSSSPKVELDWDQSASWHVIFLFRRGILQSDCTLTAPHMQKLWACVKASGCTKIELNETTLDFLFLKFSSHAFVCSLSPRCSASFKLGARVRFNARPDTPLHTMSYFLCDNKECYVLRHHGNASRRGRRWPHINVHAGRADLSEGTLEKETRNPMRRLFVGAPPPCLCQLVCEWEGVSFLRNSLSFFSSFFEIKTWPTRAKNVAVPDLSQRRSGREEKGGEGG